MEAGGLGFNGLGVLTLVNLLARARAGSVESGMREKREDASQRNRNQSRQGEKKIEKFVAGSRSTKGVYGKWKP
ncbi:hypothetical protein KFK09_021663 [Dendrobium nobile]|uniref:Uncharacterized protein n=1 Tax=Dendrobium nobile TaxID=94219 RepID=A0A8T3AQP4_DENNO|nr:hypothetical protein KFK09_021663 [Dendrobium nobile]